VGEGGGGGGGGVADDYMVITLVFYCNSSKI
jgi:hypothetical protein